MAYKSYTEQDVTNYAYWLRKKSTHRDRIKTKNMTIPALWQTWLFPESRISCCAPVNTAPVGQGGGGGGDAKGGGMRPRGDKAKGRKAKSLTFVHGTQTHRCELLTAGEF